MFFLSAIIEVEKRNYKFRQKRRNCIDRGFSVSFRSSFGMQHGRDVPGAVRKLAHVLATAAASRGRRARARQGMRNREE